MVFFKYNNQFLIAKNQIKVNIYNKKLDLLYLANYIFYNYIQYQNKIKYYIKILYFYYTFDFLLLDIALNKLINLQKYSKNLKPNYILYIYNYNFA